MGKSKQPSTKKRNQVNILPASEKGQVLFQSNRITNGKWKGFTLIQSKIFICIMGQLQTAISANMKGENWRQLGLFEEDVEGLVTVGIPLKEICRPDQYKQIYQNAEELLSIKLYFDSKNSKGNKFDSISTLFHRFDIPKMENGIKIMNVYMHKDSAQRLIEIDKNLQGSPINFTKYLKNVALKAKNKYTYRLYMIIASWKVKGGFRISLKELREQLGIREDQYKNYNHFKENILIPVQEELKNEADCWFNCSTKDFEEIENQSGKVIYLNFKVITKVDKEHNDNRADYIRNILKMHAAFSDIHLDELRSIFTENSDYTAISTKVIDLLTYVNDEKNNVGNKQAYIIKSLLNFYPG